VKPFTNPIIRAWNRWFTPQSTDPTVVYRERALRFLLPVFFLLRVPSIINEYLGIAPNLPAPYAPLWITLIFFVVPYFFSFYFLMRKEVGWAGIFFILHWYLIDMLSLPAEGYWYPGYQISLIIQVVLSTLVLPSRAILPFLVFQLTTVGVWGNWLDVNYYDPPLLSSGLPVAVFRRAIVTLGVQEAIILFIVRYLRLEMEKSLRFQQMTIEQLQTEVAERKRVETRIRGILENSPDFISEVDREGTILFASRRADEYEGTQIYRYLSPGSDEQIDAWFHGIMVQGGTTKAPEPYEVTKITFNTVQSAKAAAAAPGLQFVCEVCPTSEGWKEYSKFSPEEKEEFRRETGSIPNGNGVPLSIKPEKMDTEFYVRDWGTAGKTPASVVIASMRCWLGQLIFSGADKGGIGARMSANAITRANLESELPCWPFSCIPIRNFNGNFLTNKGYMGFNPAAEGTKVADAIALIKNRRAARNTIPQSIPILQQQQQPVNTDNFVGKVVDTGNMLEDSEKAEDGAEANGQAVPAVPAVTEIAATDDGGDFNPEF